MGVLNLKLLGINVYVPHIDKTALLVVLPNASRLGTSPVGALDGTSMKQHLPYLWEKKEKAGRFSVILPRVFLGARLSFELTGTPTGLDLSAVSPIATNGWLDVDPDLLKAAPDDRIAGQVLIKNGAIAVPAAGTCNKVWSLGSFKQSLDQVVHDLTVRIEGVDSIKAIATPWVGVDPKVIYENPKLAADDKVDLQVGNFCAEDVLDWPRNSVMDRTEDNDFKWIYGLSRRTTLSTWISNGLPVPIVDGSKIHHDSSTSQAFKDFWGGGGWAGCECNGFVDKPGTFSH
jgi:hypothetical protein